MAATQYFICEEGAEFLIAYGRLEASKGYGKMK